MTSSPAMLAIIAKAEFAKLEKSFGSISPGTVVPLDRYLSRKPAFDVLKEGGALYLVTVRPPDEQLWLMAVLENPTVEPDMWISAPNRVPTADITALIPKLKFITGTGISAKKGALGMSLQTPRRLSDGDIELLSQIVGKPTTAPAKKKARAATKPVASATASSAPSSLNALVSLSALQALTEAERKTVLNEVAARLGNAWKAGKPDNADGLPLTHQPTKLRFRLIPGGVYTMGLSDADMTQCEEYAGEYEDEIEELKKRARPLRQVTVAPFLITETPLDHLALKRLVDGYSGDEFPKREVARKAASSLGFRLPSEAELEWLARNGTDASFSCDLVGTGAMVLNDDGETDFFPKKVRSSFGLKDFLTYVWAEDDWHASYKNAPTDSEPWMEGKKNGVVRWGNLSDVYCAGNEFLWSFLSAMRETPGEPGQVMLAAPLAKFIPELSNLKPPMPEKKTSSKKRAAVK